jgi:hypothetical protein
VLPFGENGETSKFMVIKGYAMSELVLMRNNSAINV